MISGDMAMWCGGYRVIVTEVLKFEKKKVSSFQTPNHMICLLTRRRVDVSKTQTTTTICTNDPGAQDVLSLSA